ncbi:MAG: SfiI family type II restriction endonuclease [Chloroflexi bacterium]|nr:SfiI family type II restriction endonuclease [Chloroflexota bacterium]
MPQRDALDRAGRLYLARAYRSTTVTGVPYLGAPMPELDATAMGLDEIELLEKTTLRTVVQAVLDFAAEACREFQSSPDDQQDIAEDLTREAVDTLGGYVIRKRLYGNIDYKRARWSALPNGLVPQALLVDSKAEKAGSSVTLQTSQISMPIRFNKKRGGDLVDERGTLDGFVPLLSGPPRSAMNRTDFDGDSISWRMESWHNTITPPAPPRGGIHRS